MKRANVQLVGFDGSPLSEMALHDALRTAQLAELPTIHVVMVAEQVDKGVKLPSGIVLSRFEALMNLRLTVRALHAQWNVKPNLVHVVCHVLVGSVSENILNLAEKYRVERIALGAHARGELRSSKLGSLAQHIARTAPVPVSLQTAMSPAARRKKLDALRLFLLLGDGFATTGKRQSPRIANC